MSRPDTGRGDPPLARRIAAALEDGTAPHISSPTLDLPLRALAERCFVDAPAEALAGRSILIRTRSPLAAAAALASLDGVATTLVLCPPDLDPALLAGVVETAKADMIVSDVPDDGAPAGLVGHRIVLEVADTRPAVQIAPRSTVWALFTSGTSGAPKMVAHDVAGLTGAIVQREPGQPRPLWATFYDIRRYGGLQMLLRALVGGLGLLTTEPGEPMADLLARMGHAGVTHVAGTPSHWRSALMNPALAAIAPHYVRLSGEIADQPVLDALRARFPDAVIGHAYASTEAGVGFEVQDGLAGFPAALVGHEDGPVRLRVVDDALHVRSPRAARGYLGGLAEPLQDGDGWVDTGDLVERRGERFHFLGRRSGTISVGGLKISPEEVEAVLNACPEVSMSRVSARPNPLLGALVSAEVVPADPSCEPAAAKAAILARCRAALPPHKTPASIRFVEALQVGAAGKLERRPHA